VTRVRPAAAFVVAALALALGALAPNAPAIDPGLQPLELRVDGGEETWHAEPSFTLRWHNPQRAEGHAVVNVHYRLLEPTGQVALGETTTGWASTSIEHLRVPAAPGAYTAEVWLEDATGEEGVPGTAKLRFDDTRPGDVEPLPVAGWIGRNDFPYTLRLGRPTGPEPLSGIRGYAVAIDRSAFGQPCAAELCSEAETDLRGGSGEDSLAIADLPEGTSYAHAVAVSGSGVRSVATGTTALRVDKTDPVTQLAGVPAGWSNRPVRLVATATDVASGMLATLGGEVPFTAIRVDGGAPTITAGGSVAATVIESGIHAIAYYARDAAGNVADGSFGNGQPNPAPAEAVVRIDREPPHVAFANSQDPADPERIEAVASDSLSGLDATRAQIAVRSAGSGDRFEPLPTEARGNAVLARWDSAAFPAGSYEFRAGAYDAAGNATATRLRANGSSMVLSNPLKVQATLRAGFGKRSVRTVDYGRTASFSGRLTAGRRAPLSGAPVRVVERFDSGSQRDQQVLTVKTGPRGYFTVRLAPGPSREVLAVAAATPTRSGAGSRPARLTVRSGLRLRASSPVAEVGGRPVVFSGSVASAGSAIPSEGKAVELQFRLPGLPWSEFRTLDTDQRGRFRYAYRFADDDSRGVLFQFRAYAPTQSGWPFEPAASPPVAVRGR
jgi:hypothetical protein